MPKYGNSFRLYLNGTALRAETNSGISFTQSVHEATLNGANQFIDHITGIKSSTISFEGLYCFDDLEVGTVLPFHIGGIRDGYTGTCIIESIEISAGADSLITHSGTVKVIGELQKFVPIFEDSVLTTRSGLGILTRDSDLIEIRAQIN